MRVFNPEKELGKIKNGNKKKAIISICALLVVGILGYSFALYQVRNTESLVFNTVGEFKKRDIYLSVLVNGKTQNEFPGKEDGYAFSGYECDGDATVTFDPDKWMASVNSNGPDKCTIKFGAKNINYDTLRIKEDILVDETNDANLRFIGTNPSNYIWFNCLKYDDLTNENAEDEQHKCERWRIIGILNDIDTVSTGRKSLIKIVRKDSIGLFSWDNKDPDGNQPIKNGTNDWTNAELMKMMNPGYDTNTYNSEVANNSLYWNSESGKCPTWNDSGLKDCDFSEIGIKKETTEKYIENVKWNLGVSGLPMAKTLYDNEKKAERGYWPTDEQIEKGFKGYIGLPYSSDYVYGTSGNLNGTTREFCISINVIGGNDTWTLHSDCAENSWLLYDGATGSRKEDKGTILSYWTLTLLGNNTSAHETRSASKDLAYQGVIANMNIKPTLYLSNNTKIINGDGTYENPYVINVE